MAIKYSKEIKSLIDDIEVPDSEYERAVNRYNSITDYLSNSDMWQYEPEIYIQGSFKLGTAIKPLTEDGCYDIDLVCCFLKLNKQIISQYSLKKKLGAVVSGYAESNNMKSKPKDGKRCWTITYVDNHNFHLDILPSVMNGVSSEIAITDKRKSNYFEITDDWEISNPKAYYEWFDSTSKYEEYKRNYILNEAASAEEVPYYKVKTPLQRIVQLLKRHAEVMFEDNLEYKPSSVIITTLATKAYSVSNSPQDFDLLLKTVVAQLESQIDNKNGTPCVFNPVDRREILSLKWDADEKYYREFEKWINQLKFDFSIDDNSQTFSEQFSLLNRSMHKAAKNDLQISINSLPYHLKSKWREQLWKDVKIKATVYQKSFRPKHLNSGQAIGKNCDLKFEVLADNVNQYEIFWQVTNTGYEAQRVGQLRGDFYESKLEEGKKIRKESTYYIGNHYVEAFLVKNNICYGKSEPFVVSIVNGAYVI